MRKTYSALLALGLITSSALQVRAEWIDWPYENLAICTATNQQQSPVAVSDGAGGMIVVWLDWRGESFSDIYAQRVNASGEVLWATNGVPLCTASGDQGYLSIAADGSGGAVVAWTDASWTESGSKVFAQRINSSGFTQWTANGVRLCTFESAQGYSAIVSDGSGGAIVAWQDSRDGAVGVYAQRIDGTGVISWSSNGALVARNQSAISIVSDEAGGAIITSSGTGGATGPSASSNIYIQRISATGARQWQGPDNSVVVPVCTSPGEQVDPRIISDGAGGVIVAWLDARSGAYSSIYAQRINSVGVAQWTTNGVALSAASFPGGHVLAPDGAGGAILAWDDYRDGAHDIQAQRIDSSGTPQWLPDGVSVCAAEGRQGTPAIVADGANGAIISWEDRRTFADIDVYAQRINASGAAQWAPDGVALCAAVGDQNFPSVVVSTDGGAIVAWQDARFTNASLSIYAQRIGADGSLGVSPSARIAQVRDVPGDQGGWLRTYFPRSALDYRSAFGPILNYFIWERIDTPAAELDFAAHLSLSPEQIGTATGVTGVGLGTRVRSLGNAGDGGSFPPGLWEVVGSAPAVQAPEYVVRLPSAGDSSEAGIRWSVFLVTAHTATASDWFAGAPDSGYSVDNLSPPTPTPFAVVYGTTANTLHWRGRAVADLRGYQIYRGTEPTFVPSPATLVATSGDTSYVDAPGGHFYKLAAIDVHGNRSRFVSASPGQPVATLASFVSASREPRRIALTWYSGGNPGLEVNVYRRALDSDWQLLRVILSGGDGFLRYEDADVADDVRYGYRLGIVEPDLVETMLGETWVDPIRADFAVLASGANPSRDGRVSLSFALPLAATARVQLFDIAGREVDSRQVGGGSVTSQTVEFGAGARLRAGVYVVRATSGSVTLTRRVVVLN